MLFQLAGREPKYISVPVALMDFIIGAMELVGKAIPSVGVCAATISTCNNNGLYMAYGLQSDFFLGTNGTTLGCGTDKGCLAK